VPDAFRYAASGVAAGCALGIVGLWLTRWELSARALHYTPNRWLVLAVTLVVTARLLYGFWRSWQAWRLAAGDTSWVAASGVAGSLAAGAVVLGYYLAYWVGVRRRLNRLR
jgi:type VI protein secretion system component VasK